MNDEDSTITENSNSVEGRSSSGLGKLEQKRDAQILELRSLKRRKEELDLKLATLTRKLRSFDSEIVQLGGKPKADVEGYDLASGTSVQAVEAIATAHDLAAANGTNDDDGLPTQEVNVSVEENEYHDAPEDLGQEDEDIDCQVEKQSVSNSPTRGQQGSPKKSEVSNEYANLKRGRPITTTIVSTQDESDPKTDTTTTTTAIGTSNEMAIPTETVATEEETVLTPPPKRGRGRPRKHPPKPPPDPSEIDPATGRRRRGRPRKHPKTPDTPGEKRKRGRPKGSGKNQKLAAAEKEDGVQEAVMENEGNGKDTASLIEVDVQIE